MSPPVPAAPADRLARLIDGLCRSVAAQIAGRRLAGPLICLIWSRLRRIAGRFASLAARIPTGGLRRRRPAGQAARPRLPPQPRPLPLPSPLPQGFAWLLRLVPEAAAGASQLRHLLAEPDMAALIAATPQAGRILRPLCRMLGVRPPPGLARPARRAPPAAPDPPAAVARCPTPAAAPPATPPPSRASPRLRPPLGVPPVLV